ncbi:IS3 family transposase [Gordonia sp. OPL2]|uniref:IS3 family transposase n=1 Tax=Gordonia sp. OPL2 TaxID=2486274 RepID=UPI0021CCA6E3|nr:IS3 family transposase [Gordonia sp. OPL2]
MGVSVTAACALAGVARATYYRLTRGYTHYTPVTDPMPQSQRCQPAALSSAERTQVCTVLEDEDFVELSVCQAYWRAFDDERVSCSQRTFYRIARAEQMVGDRRRGRHSGSRSRKTPRVAATAPGQLWSWDVTELRGLAQQRYKLYLAIDVFSRFPVASRIEASEDRTLAVEMFTEAFTRYGAPHILHADNGAIMRSRDLLDALEQADTTASFSRPRVSDDNPFSESLFKTIKYDLNCPETFDSIDHARQWTAQFLSRYAAEHRHSGLGWHTPASVFDGTAAQRHASRQARLDALYAANPQRYRHPPRAPEVPSIVGINNKQKQNQVLSQTG